MNTKHTPGPWELFELKDHMRILIPGLEIALIWHGRADFPPPDILANARLIAAAPDLLELARKVAGYLEYLPALLEEAQMVGHAGNCTIIAKEARAAIAKAEGGK